jgi:sugar phosphate isomerase/epimerase
MKNLSRRTFLASLCATPCVRAIEPFARRGPARLRLSLAAYSFRDYFKDRPASRNPNAAPPPQRQIDLKDFIDFCAENHCGGAELTSYYFPGEPSDAFLLDLRRHAFLRGVGVSGTAVGNTFTVPPGQRRDREIAQVKTWIEHARVLGAPHIRVFAGNAEGQSAADAKRLCIEALEECGEAGGRAGVFLGLENHGGIVAEPADLLEIVRAVRSPWVGVNLDSGNFHTADPYGDFARCAPYAVNVQIKVEMRRRDSAVEPADYPRLVKILRETGYQGWVALEYEAREDPFVAVPRHLRELSALFNHSV